MATPKQTDVNKPSPRKSRSRYMWFIRFIDPQTGQAYKTYISHARHDAKMDELEAKGYHIHTNLKITK